jgi:AhpD family alkylhydroperoxidase
MGAAVMEIDIAAVPAALDAAGAAAVADSAFVDHTPESAPEGSRGALHGTIAKFGFLPSAMARLAESPAVVAAFGRLMGIWETASLGHLEREVVTLTVAHHAGCEVCMAIHSAILARTNTDRSTLDALRAQTPLADARLEALRSFTNVILTKRGNASDSELGAFFAAGFSREQALDVVLGVGTYTLSTFANRLTRATLDSALDDFAWRADAPALPQAASAQTG